MSTPRLLRPFILSLIHLGIGTIHAEPSEAKPPRPNVIIFLTDDQGYGDLGSSGHPIIKTPHLDKFAASGVRMTDMHAAGTVCSASRASMLTGRNAYRSGFYNIAGFFGTTLQRDEITLAKLLQDSGYETAYFGKWHLSKLESEKEVSVNDMGFDYSFATSVNAFDGPENPGKFLRNGEAVGKVEGWYIDIIVEDASKWLKTRRDPSKPFFMIIAAHEPHTPIAPPEKYLKIYEGAEVIELARQKILYGGMPRPEKDLTEYIKEYYGTITQIDDAFGNLMSLLDTEGLSDDSLVVYTSDNGPEYPVILAESFGEWEDPLRDKSFGTPGKLRGMKRFPYEGGHRVPGLARWPGHILAGTVSDKLFNGTDFLPTIATLAGAAIPLDRAIDGADAFGAFLNKESERKHPPMWFLPVNYEHLPGMAHMAMRHKNYVLIGHLTPNRDPQAKNHFATPQGGVDWIKTAVPTKFELYDIKKDVNQTNDLSEQNIDTLMKLIPIMQRRWLDIRDEGPWWGRRD